MLEGLRLCKLNSWIVAASEVLEAELSRMKDTEKLENVTGLYEDAIEYLTLIDDIRRLAGVFQRHGIKEYDSLHLATAEVNGYDYFLTTDDDFRRAALKLGLKVQVRNPAEWILEEVKSAPNNDV